MIVESTRQQRSLLETINEKSIDIRTNLTGYFDVPLMDMTYEQYF